MSSFSDEIKAFAKKTNARVDTVVRKSCFELSRRIMLRTPVDKGTARNNWMPSVDRIDTSTSESAKITESQIQAVAKLAWGRLYYFTNSLDYIRKLEYGYSKKSPEGMVRVSIAEFRQILRGAVNGSK